MRTLACLVFLLTAAAPAAVVQPLGTSYYVVIPAAGSTPGVNGTFFRSDISIVNLADHQQTVLVEWLPQPGADIYRFAFLAIPAKSGIRSADFVNDYFHTTGIGSIAVRSMSSEGHPLPVTDATGMLFVSSRIWTPQPGTNGTTSQSLPAIPFDGINNTTVGIYAMTGIDDPANYRTNIGIVNLADHEQTFAVQWGPTLGAPIPTGTTITLPPNTMTQFAAAPACCISPIVVTNITAADTRSTRWTAYGSTINNVTGDAWDEIGVPITLP